jgi:hypothetical protein
MLMKRLPVAEEKSRVLERLVLEPGYVVVTAHRVESVDDLGRLSGIAHLIVGLAGVRQGRVPCAPEDEEAPNGDGPVEGAGAERLRQHGAARLPGLP